MKLQQIKDSLPKFMFLVGGVHKWKDGDTIGEEMFPRGGDGSELVKVGEYCPLRPIPDEVLENQAFHVALSMFATAPRNDPAYEIAMSGLSVKVFYERLFNNGAPGFKTRKEAEDFIAYVGGAINCHAYLSAGDLYSKWLGEQLT
jgi:hypothetical protein